MKLISLKTMLGLSALLLFSCSNEDFLEQGGKGTPSDCINFGIAREDATPHTKGSSGTETYTAANYVLRSPQSADTLCMRATVTDGIHSGPQAVTRGTPVTSEQFYNKFHVLCQRDDDTSFFMDVDVTEQTDGSWASDEIYYWQGAEHRQTFYAWAPVDGAFTKPTAPNDMSFTYTVPAEADKQQDLVVAGPLELRGDYNQQVRFTFRHICTAVKFTIGSQMQAGTIKSVSLKGVRNGGTYSYTNNGWQLDDTKTAGFTQEVNLQTNGSEQEGTAITQDAGTFMMLPQTLPTDAKVEVVFADATTGEERTLSASIGGSEWPMGKTVTYQLSITPEYDLEFISEPEMQDAHYIIYPIHIKAGDNIPGGSWTLTSTDPGNVTLRTDLTVLTRRGYWVYEDRGESSISSTVTGDDITIYAFLTENVSDKMREVTLELRPSSRPEAVPETFTIQQLCPSWNGNLGCERIEDGDYPWGFLWPKGMKIKYDMENAGLGDLIKNALLNAYLSWFTDYNDFITKETWLLSITSVTIDFDKIPAVNVAKDQSNGQKNTMELYNFNGINDVSTLMDVLKDWGGSTTDVLPLNPEEFAARACSMKNMYNKTVETQPGTGETIEAPVLAEENLVWYLPAVNEATQMKDADYPLSGDYWTSTNNNIDHDNEDAYKYTAGGSTALERRDVKLHVRAVRQKPQ